MKPFVITITPRLYETDAMGHINNATLAAWLEVVRVRFLESLGSGGPMNGKDWILASVHIDYVGETFYGADVNASVIGATVGNTSLTLQCEMFQGDKPTVRGTAVMVHWDPATKTPTSIEAELRDKIASL